MSSPLKIQREFTVRSERVKCVDIHREEPWLLVALYNGKVHVWNYEGKQLIKTLEVSENPVRAARFVVRKNWVVTGADDKQVRVYDTSTWEQVHAFEAHADYIRYIAVHPTLSCILTAADDHMVKQWDWDKKWTCTQQYAGHSHYVMQLAINPQNNSQFASVSLDRTIKVWQLGSPTPLFSWEGHDKGINCVSYFTKADNLYLLSGADDALIKMWDLQTQKCIQALEVGHNHNVSSVMIMQRPTPLLLSASEDNTVRLYDSSSEELACVLNYDMGRAWTLACHTGPDNNLLLLGCDEGFVLVRIG